MGNFLCLLQAVLSLELSGCLEEVEVPIPSIPPLPAPPFPASPTPSGLWAFEETFDGDPDSPSKDLLPRDFDYVVTHRTHPQEHFKTFDSFLADHDESCRGPDPSMEPLPQHSVVTSHSSSSSDIDDSFFICKNHMMSSMGEVSPYSVSAFWPRQEFDFTNGGTLEFDVNINDGHTVRMWWEILITPRSQLKVGSGPDHAPISERYPIDRIVLDFANNVRQIKVGSGAMAPDGWTTDERHLGPYAPAFWHDLHPDDPATFDQRVRRKMIVSIQDESISWKIQMASGEYDEWSVAVHGGLPFTNGLVVFKTHSYTPAKDNNFNIFTFHWDNIRFSGPIAGLYEAFDANGHVYLQRNGSREIGETSTVAIDIPSDFRGRNPMLFGQVHHPVRGQVLLSVNGGDYVAVHPYDTYEFGDCVSEDWQTFQLPLDPNALVGGTNSLTWMIGPRPSCLEALVEDTDPLFWAGFSIKFLQIQLDIL